MNSASVFSHALAIPRGWPPTGWSHDRAAWTVEAKFVVNDYGLRNRFAIITETPGQPTFERRVYAQYAYITALLEYVAEHATEMQDVVRAADEETVANVLAYLADKLRAHNIEVTVLEEPVRVEGEEFKIEAMRTERSRGYEMTVLDGTFSPLQTRQFPAGTFYVDMAQPMANAAFYYLEPQARDGFVGWGLLDETLRKIRAGEGPSTYPIFKMRRRVR